MVTTQKIIDLLERRGGKPFTLSEMQAAFALDAGARKILSRELKHLERDGVITRGKGGGYVTAHHRQSDWYCTNRPVINAPVALPPIVRKD